jgi:CubicO group peptidase (beta-lactamase class C family)
MRMLIPNTIAVVVLLARGATVARTADPAPADPTPAVDAIFAEWKADTPGCAVGVSKDGKEVLARAYGSADLEHGVANAPDTIFEAGSVSKQFTAAAILLLAQAGKLKLDDPVRQYVPDVPDYGTPAITLRHLLHHTSGLRDWGTVTSAAGWPRGTRAHTHAHVLDIVSRQKSLNFPPGSEYLYCNTGYNLLAIVVERVSGKTFAQYTKDMIFEPLGMTHTQWRDDYTRVVKDRAAAYDRLPDGYHSQMPFENVHGNGGLLTTVGDLLRWNRNFTSERVGGRALVTELQRRGRLTDGLEISYARGLEVSMYRGLPEVSHSGSTAGYRAFLTRFPAQGLSVAVLCNTGNAKAVAAGRKVAEVYLGSALAPVVAPSPVAVDAALLARWAGLYRNVTTGEPLRIATKDGALRAENEGTLVPLSDSLFVIGEGGDRVQFHGADVARSFDAVDRDGFKVHYAIATEVNPTPAELAKYEGTYASEEAEAAYVVRVEGSILVATRRPGVRFTLAPAYHDAFTNKELPLVRFRRDARGQVVALSLGLGRVRDLRFERVPASPYAATTEPSPSPSAR